MLHFGIELKMSKILEKLILEKKKGIVSLDAKQCLLL
jgi:hypothetical protein